MGRDKDSPKGKREVGMRRVARAVGKRIRDEARYTPRVANPRPEGNGGKPARPKPSL